MLFEIYKFWCQLRADLNHNPREGARGIGGEELGELAAGGLIAVGRGSQKETGTKGGIERKYAEEHGGVADLKGDMSVSPSVG